MHFPVSVVVENDELILLHVENSCPRATHLTEITHPKVPVCLERTQFMEEASDKANTILNKSNLLGVDLLIVGQRRGIVKLPGGSGTKGLDAAEYSIENSKCNCVAVQKRGQNASYVLNTKTHKNSWLLA
ncbi:hypothetical protein NC653_021607 [Populus alba x Populus x berolinensis]|uniref:UspA domain-containing protein n=1 Tax=Populus alba x Populus x berolinensis TaxID=444605 RepID=A0AAD6QEY8_9ROSI|nr:hypothetical protein NC653_021607 [Populus alba x Populus x berolinensis]